MIDICLLGTGGMMPLPYRYLTSMMARYNGKSILIDCGEGRRFWLPELRSICGKNLVYPVRAVRERCSFPVVILAACFVRIVKSRVDRPEKKLRSSALLRFSLN